MLSKTLVTLLISSCFACGQQSAVENRQLENRQVTIPERVDVVPDLAIPDDWRHVKVCGLSISMPASLKYKRLQPIDSCIGTYEDRDTRVLIDVIPVGIEEKIFTRREEYSNCREFNVNESWIDGFKAEIINCRADETAILQYVTVLDIPEPGLTIWIHSRDSDKQKEANQIARSIRFDR